MFDFTCKLKLVINFQLIIFHLGKDEVQGKGRFEMPEEYSIGNSQSDNTVSYPSKSNVYGRVVSWLSCMPLS